MSITSETIVGELVAMDYRTASVFKKRGIDFCCNGNRSIDQACEKKKLDVDALISELESAIRQSESGTIDYQSWPLDLLADYVEKKHHRYVETKIREITPFLYKIARVHGDRHPELIEVEKLFNESARDLTDHMKKEESILFPYIRKLVQAKENNTQVHAPFGTVENPIRVMMHEHDAEGERFRKIADLTDHYTLPQDACSTYRVTFSMLKEYEDDLNLHIHLENNILFPKSIQLEEAVATA